jgi:hypothetical protein
VAASATTATAPTVRKRPMAQVVSIDQAQRAGKYQKRPQAHGSASRNQRPATAMDITANRAASRQLTGNHQPGTRASSDPW